MGNPPVISHPVRNKRPMAVKLISVFEFLKAIYILVIFRSLWIAHMAQPVAGGSIPRDMLSTDPSLIFMPLVAIALLIIGVGLLNLQRWARHALMPIAGFSVYAWGDRLYFDQFSIHTLRLFLPAPVVGAVAVADVLAVLTLVYWPEISKAFDEPDLEIWDP